MRIKRAKLWLFTVLGAVILLLAALLGGAFWYSEQLKPYDLTNSQPVHIEIKPGTPASQVVESLAGKRVIRSSLAMSIYLRLHSADKGFQAGVYSVSSADSVEEIVAHLKSGRPDEQAITFYPGAMLTRANRESDDAKYDVFTSLKTAGYSTADIESALRQQYQSPVLKGRPNGAGIEGYVYGETYFMSVDASASDVIQRAIDEMWSVVKTNKLEKQFSERGLSLYQGITLASIVQREARGCPGVEACEDQKKIAGVFFNRLDRGMELGSDVTYHYAADVRGVPRDARLESSYNTRIHKNLPPGPIASPSLGALKAVANPEKTDYLFFVVGDDGIIYYAKTNEQHDANVRLHCIELCSTY